MFQTTRISKGSRSGIASQPGPITDVPQEIVMEVFRFAVLSSEEGRSNGVKALCLVGKEWNQIANCTSDLWTKITLAYPLHKDQLSAVKKWIKTSEQRAIDLEIDLCDPAWNELKDEFFHPFADPARLWDVILVLQGSEHRWRSISFKSDVWKPIHMFLRLWEIHSLPLLESISFQRGSESQGRESTRFIPRPFFDLPILFGGKGTHMPKLRKVSLSAVHLDWTSATASFQNLRELRIRNQNYDVGPTYRQFAALLAASPRLETLDITGYFPIQSTGHELPLVYLPALKHLVFGWTGIGHAHILEMFQIPESLETLSLIDVESGLGIYHERVTGLSTHHEKSSAIFNYLADLGSRHPRKDDPRDRDYQKPWISLLGLKSLSVSWVDSNPDSVSAFLKEAEMIEEIHLTDVSLGVLYGIAALAITGELQSLKRLHIRWIWNGGYEPPNAHTATDLLRDNGFQVTVEKFTGEAGFGSTPMGLEAIFNEQNGGWRP